MKKPILLLYVFISFLSSAHSQAGQFAVVKPNGTTQVYTSWTSAYAGAVEGDYIYLPGIEIIHKLLNQMEELRNENRRLLQNVSKYEDWEDADL